MKIYICPVCGYDGLDEKPYGENLSPSYNICSCCGFEYGYSEDHDVDLGYIVIPNEMKEAAYQLYRKQWIENGAPVHTPTEFPEELQLNNKVKREVVLTQFERLQLPIDNLEFMMDNDLVVEDDESSVEQAHTVWMMDEVNKGATDKQIKQAEKQLGVRLPTLYVELLKSQDGGYIQYEAFPTDFSTSWADDHINVNELFGIGTETSILDSPDLIEEWDLPKNIILISGDGHTWIALDYREHSKNPPVILIDEDVAGIQTLAASFESFIDRLTVDEPMDWVDYVLYEASQLDEKTKMFIAAEVRNRRSNAEILKEIDRVITCGKAEQIKSYFSELIQIDDSTLELYMIKQIYDHNCRNVREVVAEHLAACAIRGNDSLAPKDVKEYLIAMEQKESDEHIRYLIELGLENIRKSEWS